MKEPDTGVGGVREPALSPRIKHAEESLPILITGGYVEEGMNQNFSSKQILK